MALSVEQQLARNTARRARRLTETPATTRTVQPATRDGYDEAAREVPIERVRSNPHNARQIDLNDPEQAADMDDLVQSIKTHGILQPPLVRHTDTGDYEVIAGDRRLLAARTAGLATIPVRLRQASGALLQQLNLVENLVRSNLSAVELGQGFDQLKKTLQGEEENATPGSLETETKKIRWDDVAAVTGLTPRTMQRYIAAAALLDDLDLAPAEKAKATRLSEKQLRSVLSVPDKTQQKALLQQVVEEKLSSRQVEARARELKGTSRINTTSHAKSVTTLSRTSAQTPDKPTTANDESHETAPTSDPEQVLIMCETQASEALELLRHGRFSTNFFKQHIEPHIARVRTLLEQIETIGTDRLQEDTTKTQ